MSNMSNYLETIVSNSILRGVTIATDAYRLYLALYTVAPTDAGGGTEATFTGYARQPFRTGGQVNTDQFTVPDGAGTASNSQVLTYAANAGAQQIVVAAAIHDAVTAGNQLFQGALNSSKTIDPTDVLSFPAASVKITWD